MNQIVTPRESQVIELLSFGFSVKEIADALGCSENTIDTHIKNAKHKMGLQKNTEIVLAELYKKYKLPLCDLPVKIRRIIATAMLALSLFGIALTTTDFLRVLRPAAPSRTANTKPGARRGAKQNENYILAA